MQRACGRCALVDDVAAVAVVVAVVFAVVAVVAVLALELIIVLDRHESVVPAFRPASAGLAVVEEKGA